MLKDLSHIFLLLKSLKQTKIIISPFSVQLFSISPRKRFIRILRFVRLSLCGPLRPSASLCVPPRMILVISLYDQTRRNAEERRGPQRTAEKRRGTEDNTQKIRTDYLNPV